MEHIPKIETNIDWKNHAWEVPSKKIKNQEDMMAFSKSAQYSEYMTFIGLMQESVVSKSISSSAPKFESSQNQFIKKFNAFLVELGVLCDQTQLLPKESARFGNGAFKHWHQSAVEKGEEFFKEILTGDKIGAHDELIVYFGDSFGSNVRIDYGTGHEMNFAILLLCLLKLGLYDQSELEIVTRYAFYEYIRLMRKLQDKFTLEPAGSHGVWGLDDYHFLPFLLGGAELIHHPVVKVPGDIHRLDLLEDYHHDFMYLDCIKVIRQVKKTAAFSETSPMLNDISHAASWEKIAMGMTKMYQAEVLQKVVVAKHFWFGSLFKYHE